MRKAFSALFTWLSGLKRTVVIGVVAFMAITAMLGYFKYVYDDRAAVKAEVVTLKAQAKADAKQHTVIVKGLTDKAKDERTANEHEAPILNRVASDRTHGDGAISPVVRNALIGLRDYEAKLGVQDSE